MSGSVLKVGKLQKGFYDDSIGCRYFDMLSNTARHNYEECQLHRGWKANVFMYINSSLDWLEHCKIGLEVQYSLQTCRKQQMTS